MYRESTWLKFRSERAVVGGVHVLFESVPGTKVINLDSKDAALFHYREGPVVFSADVFDQADTEMLKYHQAMASHPLLPALIEVLTDKQKQPRWIAGD